MLSCHAKQDYRIPTERLGSCCQIRPALSSVHTKNNYDNKSMVETGYLGIINLIDPLFYYPCGDHESHKN